MKKRLKDFTYLICFSGLFFLLFGCAPWIPVPVTAKNYGLEGHTEIKQPDHSVTLCGVDYLSPAGGFTLIFRGVGKGKPAAVNLIEANYQYYSENWQPLEVVSVKPLEIALVPKAKIVSKPSPKRTERTGEMLHGRYKISVKYILNGRDYECNFDVRYDSKTKAGFVGPWSGKEIH